MAYIVDWLNLVVTIPRADLVVVSASPEVYDADVIEIWRNLHDIQDGFPGMSKPRIMAGIPPTSFGPRGLLIDPEEAGWLIKFEDGDYMVNLINGNSDIQSHRVQNNVSISDKTLVGQDPDAIAQKVWAFMPPDVQSDMVTMMLEKWRRLDLDPDAPNTHWKDSSRITNGDDIDLVATDNGDTFTVQRQ